MQNHFASSCMRAIVCMRVRLMLDILRMLIQPRPILLHNLLNSNCIFQLSALKNRGRHLGKLKSDSIQSIDSSEIDFSEMHLRKDSADLSSWRQFHHYFVRQLLNKNQFQSNIVNVCVIFFFVFYVKFRLQLGKKCQNNNDNNNNCTLGDNSGNNLNWKCLWCINIK